MVLNFPSSPNHPMTLCTGHAFSSVRRWTVLQVKCVCDSSHPRVHFHNGQARLHWWDYHQLSFECTGKISNAAVHICILNTRN